MLDRVMQGEVIVVTRQGAPVAELAPLRRKGVSPAELVAHRRALPSVDPAALPHDNDAVIDPSLAWKA